MRFAVVAVLLVACGDDAPDKTLALEAALCGCVAVFIPKIVSDCKKGMHLAYVWDGTRITHYYEMTGLKAL